MGDDKQPSIETNTASFAALKSRAEDAVKTPAFMLCCFALAVCGLFGDTPLPFRVVAAGSAIILVTWLMLPDATRQKVMRVGGGFITFVQVLLFGAVAFLLPLVLEGFIIKAVTGKENSNILIRDFLLDHDLPAWLYGPLDFAGVMLSIAWIFLFWWAIITLFSRRK